MCSITALLNRNAPLDADRKSVLHASRCQQHRGPDWSGIREFPAAIVAHERLAIVDVLSGAQPLVDPDTGTVLAVNGEPVVNVRQMYGLVERLHHEADHLHFELKCVGGNAAVVVETATAIAVRDDILETYRIPAHASKDLLEGGVA